jgi:hypothetical protein
LVWQLMKYELKWVELNGFQDASTPIGYAKKVTYQEEDEEKARPDADGRGGDGCCSLGGPCCLRARRSNSELDCSIAPECPTPTPTASKTCRALLEESNFQRHHLANEWFSFFLGPQNICSKWPNDMTTILSQNSTTLKTNGIGTTNLVRGIQ